MSQMYDTVKKHDKQIDDLQKKSDKHEERINTLETQGMATKPEQTVAPTPQNISVKIPDDVVRKRDLNNAVLQIKETTQKAVSESSKVPPPTVTVSPMTALDEFNYTNKTAKAVEDKVAVPLREMRNSVEGNNTRLDRIERNMADTGELVRLRLKVKIMYAVYALITALMVIFVVVNHQDIEHLKRVEWLYRWSRIYRDDTEEYQDFERRMLQGTKKEREGMKTKIFNLESKAPQFIYFIPFDDWQPEPPNEEKPKEVAETKSEAAATKNNIDYTLMPHKNPNRFTPGEIANIKKMRVNPHIPDDAKPQLPEGYE